MRKPLARKALVRERWGSAHAVHVPAPVGGWNTRDSIADMSPNDAILLDNWFPRASELVQRGGSADWATGMTGGAVKSLAQYNSASGTKKLFAVTDSGLFDVTATGNPGATVQALTNGYWLSVVMTNSAGVSYLWGANGVDTPKMYDGAAWTTPTTTGVAGASVVAPWLFKHRIFFIEKNTMNMYYLPFDSIQGVASVFPLGNLFKLGGNLVAGTHWTLDSGEGADDLLAVITSEGQLAVYQGTDPSSAAAFALNGVYTVGRPLGRRCFFQLAGDVGVLTENGVFMLSKLLASGGVNYKSALSNKIQPSWTAAVTAGGVTTQGWEGCVYAPYDALIINVMAPSYQLLPQQFVINTVTSAWCSFSGWAPLCMITFNGTLYFGIAGGKVEKAWDGTLTGDNGGDVTTTSHQAYNYFNSPDSVKRTQLFRTVMAYSGTIDTRWAISADFSFPGSQNFIGRGVGSPGSPWDTSSWDTSSWSPDSVRYKLWRSAAHIPGYCLSLWLQTIGNNGTVSWAGTDWLLDQGGTL